MESSSVFADLRVTFRQSRMLVEAAKRLQEEFAEALAKSRATHEESRRLRGADRQPSQDEIVERLIVVLSQAGYTAVKWNGEPPLLIAPEPKMIQ
jgi:hypothetical protein